MLRKKVLIPSGTALTIGAPGYVDSVYRVESLGLCMKRLAYSTDLGVQTQNVLRSTRTVSITRCVKVTKRRPALAI